MIIDLPSTTTSAINRQLVELRSSGGAVALGRVLTLIVVTEPGRAEVAIGAAIDASREHPCRVLVIVVGDAGAPTALHAQIRVGGDSGAGEVVVLRIYGELCGEGASVVVPLLLPDAPIVTWWPGIAPDVPADDPVGRLAQRRITDAAAEPDPIAALTRRGAGYRAGDTDFAWTRITQWRALLAAAVDLPPSAPITSAVVTGGSDSPSTSLMASWLALVLDCPVQRQVGGNGGMHSVSLERARGRIQLERPSGSSAILHQEGEPDHVLSLPRRSVAMCLAEELRRLDPDVVYGDVIAVASRAGADNDPVPATVS